MERLCCREGKAIHTPVLPVETLAALSPRAGGRYLDGTLGLAGHASTILHAVPECELCGLDRDEEALVFAREKLAPFGSRVHVFHDVSPGRWKNSAGKMWTEPCWISAFLRCS